MGVGVGSGVGVGIGVGEGVGVGDGVGEGVGVGDGVGDGVGVGCTKGGSVGVGEGLAVADGGTTGGGALPIVLMMSSKAMTARPPTMPSAITSLIGAGSWRRCSAGRRTMPVRR